MHNLSNEQFVLGYIVTSQSYENYAIDRFGFSIAFCYNFTTQKKKVICQLYAITPVSDWNKKQTKK